MKRDSINWAEMKIPTLFSRLFIPTLLGMLMMSSITIIDGIFVGNGVGSSALAAVNIIAPLFLFSNGVGLMFGVGVSIVASVHLANKKEKAANINVTQAFLFSFSFMLMLSLLLLANGEEVARLLGSSDGLLPYVKDYMYWVVPILAFAVVHSIGMFVIRLDGNPKFAMICNVVPGIVNLCFDWLLIFPCKMGIRGAAMATSISMVVGFTMVLVYMARHSRQLHFYRLKLTRMSLRLSWRNIKYQMRLGASGMIGDLAIACMMFMGNYAFMRHLGVDGVAAFSVACFFFPFAFMVGNAISQSAQPIISYNYGAGLSKRVGQTLRLTLVVGTVLGLLMMLGGIFEGRHIVSLFLPDATSAAAQIASKGFPYFSLAFLFFTLNLVLIGYLQSMERYKPAIIFTLLRGVVFLIPAFLFLPLVAQIPGLWGAVPASELLALLALVGYSSTTRHKKAAHN